MTHAKYQKDTAFLTLLKRRAEISLFLIKERQPMKKTVNELLRLYPQLKQFVVDKAKKKKLSLDKFLSTRTAVQLAVINAYLLKKVVNRKFNSLDVNIAKNYDKFTAYAVDKINSLSKNYLDIINHLYHYRINKVPLSQLKKVPKTKKDLDAYLKRLNVVDK